jgi:hypothetical protein
LFIRYAKRHSRSICAFLLVFLLDGQNSDSKIGHRVFILSLSTK